MDAISLACVDRSIARHVGSHLTNIADLLAPEDILLDLDVSNKGQLFEAIDRHMVQEHAMAKGFVAMSLANRERVGSTGLGDGVAVPHAHVKNLDHVQLAYIRLKSPIAFDAPDRKRVSDVLVLLVPNQANQEHLNILAEVTQIFPDRQFRERLHQCNSPSGVKRLFDSWVPLA